MNQQIIEYCDTAYQLLENLISDCEKENLPHFAICDIAKKIGYVQGIFQAIKIYHESNLTVAELTRNVFL